MFTTRSRTIIVKVRKALPTEPVAYPSGVCLETEKGFFYVKSGKRYKMTRRVMESWNFSRVIQTTEAATAGIKVGGKIGFRDGSLIYNIADGRMYLVSENKRRHITSPDVLLRLGATGKDVVTVSDDDIEIQQEGTPIS